MDHAPAADHSAHDHHELPTDGRALTGVAVSATLHCLTGCAIGEVAGMAIGTALGFSDLGTIALAVALAFIFGYALTSLPLLRAGFALGSVIPIALAADTLSITTMEIVDNAIMLIVPGAMESGLGDILFWGALSFALAVAFVLTVPVNIWLIRRGKGHTAIHETGVHGGPPTRVVGAAVILAAIFGSSVLIAEAVSDDGDAGHAPSHEEMTTHGETMASQTSADDVRGLSAGEDGLRVELDQASLPPGEERELSFRILAGENSAVTDFDVEHEREMHLIVVRRDLTGFQHLHPRMGADGTWSTPLTLPDAGEYRVFADFNHAGESLTLAEDLTAPGDASPQPLPPPTPGAETDSGYGVTIEAGEAVAGQETELAFEVDRDGEAIEVESYLGAGGHLVALREGDLAFLHVHPIGGSHGGGHTEHSGAADVPGIRFMTEFPTAGAYRLFLQFKHGGKVHTAAFTREVG